MRRIKPSRKLFAEKQRKVPKDAVVGLIPEGGGGRALLSMHMHPRTYAYAYEHTNVLPI